jgi:hypothetical protein
MGRLKPLALSALDPVVAPPPLPLLSDVSRLFSSDVIGRWNTGNGAMTTSGSWGQCYDFVNISTLNTYTSIHG